MLIENYINESIQAKVKLLDKKIILENIKKATELITSCYKNGNKVIIAGNGGSAADSQHMACELVSKFNIERNGLPAIALTTNTSILTSIGNDYGFENVFARQVQAYGNCGDIFIAISTSGNSINIIKSLEEAKSRKLINIGLTGEKESKMDSLCDLLIKVPSTKTSIIQETHIMIEHIICEIVEKNLFM